MREIKFRVWDECDKSMMNLDNRGYDELRFIDNGWEIHNYECCEINPTVTNETGILMQYTGLKDKNGVEIYEGDIVENYQWNPSIFEVKFMEGSFIFTDVYGTYHNSPHHLRTFEVIGNIYENKDLIGK